MILEHDFLMLKFFNTHRDQLKLATQEYAGCNVNERQLKKILTTEAAMTGCLI